MAEWGAYLKRIFRPVCGLAKNGRFSLYFFIVICILGALGTWIPAGRIFFGSESITALNVYHNLATYTISIAVTALADCLVRSQNENGTFRLLLLSLTVFSVGAAIIVLVMNEQNHMWWLSLLGGLAAVLVWLNVHESDRTLTDSDPLSPLGGELP